jgi:chemotaxis protein histidine kinase CheA
MSEHNDMMMDLFRSEVESHSESLTTALLTLEQDASATEVIDGMMRAAHSVKGAARIVQIEPAVEVSHVMEDCFVAAQRGEILLRPSGIDVLLKGVDMLTRISEESRHAEPNWSQLRPTITHLVTLLKQVHAGQEPADVGVASDLETNSNEPIGLQQDSHGSVPSASHDDAPGASADEDDDDAASEPELTLADTADPIGSAKPSPAVYSEPMSAADNVARTIVFPRFLNAAVAEDIRQEYLTYVSQATKRIDLDLSNTHDMDAIGLAFLDSLAAHAAISPKVAVSITAVSPAIERVIRCLGLKSLLAVRS